MHQWLYWSELKDTGRILEVHTGHFEPPLTGVGRTLLECRYE